MRLAAIVVLWFCSSAALLGQGQIVFNNRVQNTVVAPVYDVDRRDPLLAKYGNTSTGVPAGTQVYGGAPLAGTGFTAQLFGGTTNTPSENLHPLPPLVHFRTGDAAGFVVPPDLTVPVPGVSERTPAKIQLRAWNNDGGQVTNWEQVIGEPSIARGQSRPFITPPLGGVFVAPPNLIGLESFNLFLPIQLTSPSYRTDGKFQFNYINGTGIRYCIEASGDLAVWTSVGRLDPGSGVFVDTNIRTESCRFYRVVSCSPR